MRDKEWTIVNFNLLQGKSKNGRNIAVEFDEIRIDFNTKNEKEKSKYNLNCLFEKTYRQAGLFISPQNHLLF